MDIERLEEINDLLIHYASGNFDEKGVISERMDEIDSIINGINMLGEELESSTVSRDYFSDIFNTVSDFIIIIRPDFTIKDLNLAVIEHSGLERGALINTSLKDIGLTDNWKKVQKSITKAFEGNLKTEFECNFSGTDNSWIPIVGYSRLLKDHQENLVLLIAKDVTFQKENEIRVLNTIVKTQEEERRRVSKELHDSFGQSLTAIKLYINILNNKLPESVNNKVKSLLGESKELLDEIIEELRDICFNLMPGSLTSGNIVEALKQLTQRLSIMESMRIEMKVEGEVRDLPQELEFAVFRVCQEFMNNSIKYAQASLLTINIKFLEKKFVISLEDNGEGFDFKQALKKDSNGLKNISTRIKAQNGKLEFNSTIGKGTKLVAEFN